MSAGRTVYTYGNWQEPKSAGLLGLGASGTALLITGLFIALVVTVVKNILWGGGVFAVFALVLGLMLMKDKHGRNLLVRTSDRHRHRTAKAAGTTLLRNGPLGRTGTASCQLPGLLAPTSVTEGRDSFERPFAMLYVPKTGDYSVVLASEPDGAALVDQEQVDVWVAEFGHFLLSLSDEPDVVAAQITIEAAPDTGSRLRREVASALDPNAPEFARQVMAEIVEDYPNGSANLRAYVALTFAATPRLGGRTRSRDEMLRELATRLPGFTAHLEMTGAGAAHPLSAQELSELVRVAYDPAAQTLIEEAHASGHESGVTWDDAGPSAHDAEWDHYRHDGSTSITWQMTGAPRGKVRSDVLRRFLQPHPHIARKRVTLLYKPINAAAAADVAEKDVNNSGFNQSATNKRPSARSNLRTQKALRAAEEEADGASLVNFGIMATATVQSHDQYAVDDARAAIENTAPTARLRLRIVHGAQDSAFAAALPLGLVLPKHLSIPTALKR